MKKIFTTLAFTASLLVVPAVVFAQSVTGGLVSIGGIVDTFTKTVVRALASLMLTSAVAVFFFGIVQYIWGLRQGDAVKTKVGNNFMVWGLVALFVMFSVWGIIRYAQGIFGVTDTKMTIPSFIFGESARDKQNASQALPNAQPCPSQYEVRDSNGNCSAPAVY